MKPFKTRVTYYLIMMASQIVLVSGLLFTGYDYSNSKGFYLSDERSPMRLGEVLLALPSSLLIHLGILLAVVVVIEVVVFLASKK